MYVYLSLYIYVYMYIYIYIYIYQIHIHTYHVLVELRPQRCTAAFLSKLPEISIESLDEDNSNIHALTLLLIPLL